ncbi:MAG TPA: bifunctional nuclease domain-containing protein [Ktedonobacteraceae bacterium]|nr:bifunctional nuclease domain-containing protein [Ktedonobacteraceae bacterium]
MERTLVELVAQARLGDRDAFGCLIERYEGMVTRLVTRMIVERAVARELAQEAFVQAYLSLDHLRDAARFESWLYGITLNVCRGYLRDRKTQALSLDSILDGLGESLKAHPMDGGGDPQSIAEEREMRRHVLHAVMGLSPGERAVTLLFYYEQHTMQEIAQSLSISITAVKGRLYRARNQLRAQLASLYEVLPQERHKQREQRKKREKVSKQHMRPITIASVREHPTTQQHVVVLKDDTDRKLPIWIGKPEAWAIASGLQEVETPRPMTAQLMLKLLEATGATLEEVRIDSLKDEIFYATLKIRGANGEQELDARPSDALSLAVLVKCPIYVSDEVMERCNQYPSGRDLPPLDDYHTIDRAAIEQDLEERKAALSKVISEMAELAAHQHKLESEQAKQKQIDEWKEGRE